MRIILAQFETRTDQTVTTGTIDEVSRAKSAFAGVDRDPVRVKCEIGYLGARQDAATGFGRMIQEQLVEHRTLDLVGGRVLAPEDVTEQKPIAPSAAGGNDFAAIFHNDIRSIDFLFDSHSLKGTEAPGQEGLADFEARKFFLFKNRNVPSFLGQ